MARRENPFKVDGSKDFIHPLKQMIKGFADEDPPTEKKLPVDVDVVETCCKWGNRPGATAKERLTGNLILIAFYYLLRVGEYTCKKRNGRPKRTKKTVNFRLCDVAFFKRDALGRLRVLPANATPEQRLSADGATLKLTNQKNGWKNVCIHQQRNNLGLCDPVETIARVVNELMTFTNDGEEFLSAFLNEKGKTQQIIPSDIAKCLQEGALKCDYPGNRGCPIDRINTHSLRSGGANALSLAGYKEHQIQKMGRWSGKTFKEYISEQLSSFSDGMSTDMATHHDYVNIAASFNIFSIAEDGQTTDVTEQTLESEYDPPVVSDNDEE